MDGDAIEIFFSFVSSETKVYNKIRKQLSLLEQDGRIRCWSRKNVRIGQEEEDQVKQHLENAQVIVLLLSADYLASNHYQVEVPTAMRRQQAGNALVVPILVRPCDSQDALFSDLKALPDNGKPISQWENCDVACHEIAAEIKAAIPLTASQLQKKRQEVDTTPEIKAAIPPTASQGTSDPPGPVRSTSTSQRKIIGLAILLVVALVVAFLIGERSDVLVNPPQPDIILCLTTTSYTPDLNPPPDHGFPHPAFLKTNFILLNRSTTQSTVIFVHISILGRTSLGRITRNIVDWAPTKPVVVAGKALVPNIKVSTVIDVAAEITSFQSAESQVTWIGGLGKVVNHTFNGDWQNDPACSS